MRALGLDEVWWMVSPGNPLKPRGGMAPLAARVASARAQARLAPIRVTAIEREFGTRYTIDTLRKLRRRWPNRQFIWLMGSDNLAQFDQWRQWRDIARLMPIAVIARPGYDDDAIASPAMAWLRKYRKPAASIASRGRWSAPALVILRFDPDSRSATAIRRADPDWAEGVSYEALRDDISHRPIPGNAA
jgi:nicotinate-nucleotide adenylyltransferase